MKRCILSIILLVGLALQPALVTAQAERQLTKEQQEQLVELVEQGKSSYDRGKFQTGLEKFRQAYDIYPHPDILYRIALCHERLGEDEQAVRYYRQFLAEVPDAPERPRIEKTIEVIESRISKSEIRVTTQPHGAVVYIDDEANGAAGYTPTELPVKPGNYRIIVKKEGYDPVEELVEVPAGQTVQLRYQLREAAPQDVAAPAGTKAPGARSRTPEIVALTAVGIGSAVAAGIFFPLWSDTRDELAAYDAEIEAAGSRQVIDGNVYRQAERRSTTYLVLGVSTASVAAASLLWAYLLWQTETTNQHATVDAEGSPSVAGTIGAGWNQGPEVHWTYRF